MMPSRNASSSARSRRPRAGAGDVGASGGVSLRGLGVSGRIDVDCAVSDVASRQIAAKEMRCVIIGRLGGNVRRAHAGGEGAPAAANMCAVRRGGYPPWARVSVIVLRDCRDRTYQTSHLPDVAPSPDIAPARHRTCQTSHLPDIAPARHRTCQTSHLPDIAPARHRTCQTPHLPDTAPARHRTCQTPHLPDTAPARHRTCQTAATCRTPHCRHRTADTAPADARTCARPLAVASLAVASFGSRVLRQSRPSAVASFGSRVLRQSRPSAVALLGSRVLRQSRPSAVASFGSRVLRQSRPSAVASFGSRVLRQSRPSAVASFGSRVLRQSRPSAVASFGSRVLRQSRRAPTSPDNLDARAVEPHLDGDWNIRALIRWDDPPTTEWKGGNLGEDHAAPARLNCSLRAGSPTGW